MDLDLICDNISKYLNLADVVGDAPGRVEKRWNRDDHGEDPDTDNHQNHLEKYLNQDTK